MKDCFSMDNKTKELTCIFLKYYNEKYDSERLISLLHPDIIWIDGNTQEKYVTRKAVAEYLFQKEKKSINLCEVEDKSCHITCVGDTAYMVDGCARLRHSEKSTCDSLYFSFVWTRHADSFLLVHANVSLIPEENAIYCMSGQEMGKLRYHSYQKALDNSGIAMLEYDILTGNLFFFQDTVVRYRVPAVLSNEDEGLASLGVIEESSLPGVLEMFEKIRAGEAVANCYIREKNKYGRDRYFELSMTNFFDQDGKPVRAVGVRRAVSNILLLQKEKEYGKNLTADQKLIFEADVYSDSLEFMDEEWKNNIREYIDVDSAAYHEIVHVIVEEFVSSEYKKILKEKLSKEYIELVYKEGKKLISFEYRRKSTGRCYIWYKAIISIIQDSITGNLNIRYYHSNIHEEKIRLLDEQKLYKTLKSRAEWIYEIDYTADRLISGHENWGQEIGIDITDNYTHMIGEFAHKAVHEDDRKAFLTSFNRKKIMKAYQEGENQAACSYRKADRNGHCRWHNCLVQLYKEEQEGNIRGIAYVEDIDEQKREELVLKYKAEHDVTTGVFNKSTTERKISELLVEPECCYAFIIIDIDCFKGVNDNFGHFIGDEVIKRVAERIKSSFREDDIVGRIGGDEFCVFMKFEKSQLAIEKKAKELCEILSHVYHVDDISCRVSASIGISIYDKDVRTYEELYQQADRFLYEAKRNGRNQYQMEKCSYEKRW